MACEYDRSLLNPIDLEVIGMNDQLSGPSMLPLKHCTSRISLRKPSEYCRAMDVAIQDSAIKITIVLFFVCLCGTSVLQAEDLGNLSANPSNVESTANPFGKGSPFAPNGINNPYSPYRSPFSNQSATNPFATDAPRLYDQEGNYRGKLSANPFDPDSTSNQFGRFGSPFSGDSLNNPIGAGSPYRPDSPNNPYGKGWKIEGR